MLRVLRPWRVITGSSKHYLRYDVYKVYYLADYRVSYSKWDWRIWGTCRTADDMDSCRVVLSGTESDQNTEYQVRNFIDNELRQQGWYLLG